MASTIFLENEVIDVGVSSSKGRQIKLDDVNTKKVHTSTDQRKLFVGNLHQSTSEGDLIKLFQFCGTVVSIEYKWHKNGPLKGIPKGFAFIEMSSVGEAQSAITRLSGQIVRGRKIIVSPKNDNQMQEKNPIFSSQISSSKQIVIPPRTSDMAMHYKRQGLTNPNIAGSKRAAIVASCIDDNIKKLKASLNNT